MIGATAPLLAWWSGCLPIPHTNRFAPDTTVQITEDGTPMEGLEVRFHSHRGREPVHSSSVTDAAGSARFEGPRRFSPVLVMGDRFDTWSVHIAHGEELTVQRGGVWGGAKAETIRCDLAEPLHAPLVITVDHGREPLPGGGACWLGGPGGAATLTGPPSAEPE